MNAEERLAELKAGDLRRQARRRNALREKGMTQLNVWLSPTVKAVIDRSIAQGRFKSRTEAIDWALEATFAQETTMS